MHHIILYYWLVILLTVHFSMTELDQLGMIMLLLMINNGRKTFHDLEKK